MCLGINAPKYRDMYIISITEHTLASRNKLNEYADAVNMAKSGHLASGKKQVTYLDARHRGNRNIPASGKKQVAYLDANKL